MTPFAKKLLLSLAVLIVLGLVIVGYRQYNSAQHISSYDECAAAGYPILESYPPQCKTPDGRTFVASTPDTANNQWETFTDRAQGLTFQYPKDLATKYISTLDWPPKVALMQGPFTCTEAGSVSAPAGKTEKRTVGSRIYCVTTRSEGAAGSIYSMYAYAVQSEDKVAIFTFSLRQVQCANYDDPQKTECQNEQANFNVDTTLDRVAATLQVSAPATGQSSGISGTVMIGPTCPVETVPANPKCADKPYKTTLVVTTGTKASVVATFTSDSDGKFSVAVPPGKYQIQSSSGGLFPRCSSGSTITVVANTYSHAEVSCDSGIR